MPALGYSAQARQHAALNAADLHLADVHLFGLIAPSEVFDKPQAQQLLFGGGELAQHPLQPFGLLDLLKSAVKRAELFLQQLRVLIL